ncbi:SusD/RagB family nutrient-binding outer membrane lipoprotein [Portibacter marinus]|uniref:SusD/RagB family nutrient-binding outer membrane lipoprotein n=1 Tax=Portibacter marinus TaxID=2898660 RepID=UPI001F17693D|nr:SusD/RagB family nutrient-binding outer membrane lipoprotein [Portibacter marinus]
MKLIYKMLMVIGIFAFTSACTSFELDLLENPNAVAPENASLNDLYNNIQLTFRNVFAGAQGSTGGAARMYHVGGGTYENFATPETFDGLWINAYSNLFPDVEALEAISEGQNFNIHTGSAKIFKAYTLLTLVDIFGDVPLSEALQGTDVISPSTDPGSSVYDAALSLLDEAIAELDGTNAASPRYEGFYGGDNDNWIKAANSIKLKAALNKGDAGAINSLVSGGNIIDEASEDFQFNYGSQRNNPNSRHPFYNSHYEQGDGAYMSNYYMWLLAGDKVDLNDMPIIDPRIRYYFYRKVDDAEGQDLTTYGCHYSVEPVQSAKPAHWEATSPNVPYCVIPNSGYSGRDHLNPQGIPPDGNIRTSYGLYPGGGQFDDDEFDDTRQLGTTGGMGQGIWPILISPMVDLMRAEAALTLGTNDDARELLEKGMRASIAKAVSFESLVPGTMGSSVTLRDGSEGTIKELFGTNDEDIDNYVEKVLAIYDAADADGKLDLVAKEMMIASWGNGLEAYNLYRRTGKPNNMQPALEAAFGQFPRTFLYPAINVTRNASVSQKELGDNTFWMDSSIDLY